MSNGKNLKNLALFSATILCWLALAGCPGFAGRYSLFLYLPLHRGDTWTFGCAGAPPGDALEGVFVDFSIADIHHVNGRAVCVVSQKDYSDKWENPIYAADTYYVFDDDILYTATSLQAVEDLPASRDIALKAFIHTDLTPREIADENDPVRKRYAAPIRYSAGPLGDFLPIPFTRQSQGGAEPVSGTIDAQDFGQDIQGLADCVALEVNRADADESPRWVPALILGRGVGPLLAEDGNGGYIALQGVALAGPRSHGTRP